MFGVFKAQSGAPSRHSGVMCAPRPTLLIRVACCVSNSRAGLAAWLHKPRPVCGSRIPSSMTPRGEAAGRGLTAPGGRSKGRVGGALCACHPWAIAWSLPHGALAPDVAAAGLELAPGAPCSLTPAGPSPPGKREGRVAGSLPTRRDPRDPSLAVGNLASVTGRASQLSQSQAPPGTLRDITEQTNQAARGCGDSQAQLQDRRTGRDSPTAPAEGRGPHRPRGAPPLPSRAPALAPLTPTLLHAARGRKTAVPSGGVPRPQRECGLWKWLWTSRPQTCVRSKALPRAGTRCRVATGSPYRLDSTLFKMEVVKSC